MKKIPWLCCWLLAFSVFATTEEEETTLVKTGQPAPAIQVTTLDGKSFGLQSARGKVVLVNFFATWCGPCMAEMPQLQDQIWNQFKDKKNFVMIAIDREETEQVVRDFQKQRQFAFPIACDPKREVYAKFATKFIPRSFLIDAKGNVVFESIGYSGIEFKKLIAAINQEIAKAN